jgi:hypothetical protein
MVELYLHFSMRLIGVALNQLRTGSNVQCLQAPNKEDGRLFSNSVTLFVYVRYLLSVYLTTLSEAQRMHGRTSSESEVGKCTKGNGRGLRHRSSICSEEVKKTTKSLSQDSLCLS